MDEDFAQQFAAEWLDAWNAHDLDAILGHFSDDVIFTSPLAQRIVEGSDGGIDRLGVAGVGLDGSEEDGVDA